MNTTKMHGHHSELGGTFLGVVFGSVMGFFSGIQHEIMTTVVLSVIGGVVGYCTSLFMKWVHKKIAE